MLRKVRNVSGLLQLAVNMQQEGAAQQLLQHITWQKDSSPQVAALYNLLHVCSSETSVEEYYDDPATVEEQRQQQQQQSVAYLHRLLQVAVLRGHCKLAQQLAELPAADHLQPEHLAPLLHQTIKLYEANATTAAPGPGGAATATAAAARRDHGIYFMK
jgi:hypothetical protein